MKFAALIAGTIIAGTIIGGAISVVMDDNAKSVSNDTASVSVNADTAYLTMLAAKNVGITSPANGIIMGHRVCDALVNEHVNRWMEGTRLVAIGYTGDEAATIVGASVASYCQNQAASYDNQR